MASHTAMQPTKKPAQGWGYPHVETAIYGVSQPMQPTKKPAPWKGGATKTKPASARYGIENWMRNYDKN